MPIRIVPIADENDQLEVEVMAAKTALETERAGEPPPQPKVRRIDGERRVRLLQRIFGHPAAGRDGFRAIRAVMGRNLTDDQCFAVCRELRIGVTHQP